MKKYFTLIWSKLKINFIFAVILFTSKFLKTMKISTNTVAEIAYTIMLGSPNGMLIEYADEDNPRKVILGRDDLIVGFAEGLAGKMAGPFSFLIKANKAFGQRDESLKTEVSKDAFLEAGKIREDLLFVGNKINMIDNNGLKRSGYVLDIKDNTVVMDFNHPLSGKDLFVSGSILSVREISKADTNVSNECGCGSDCGCQAETNNELLDDNCEVCGNPPEKMGQGYGQCQCGN